MKGVCVKNKTPLAGSFADRGIIFSFRKVVFVFLIITTTDYRVKSIVFLQSLDCSYGK